MAPAELSSDTLRLDAERTVEEISERMREVTYKGLRRRGAVIGLSGGVDSSVVAHLCAHAFGPERVLGVLMPEGESAPDTLDLSQVAADAAGVQTVVEDITHLLEAAGCYERRDAAIRTVMPEYAEGWKAKIVLPSLLGNARYSLFTVVAESPEGERHEARLTATAYREVVAATNFKQRVRKMLEYHHADRLDYAVVGNAEPPRVRPGVLREERRRLRRREADRPPLQDPGLPARRAHGRARGDPRAPAHDGHVRARAEPGGVLLLRPVRQARPLPLRTQRGPACEAAAGATGLETEIVERVFEDIERKRRAAEYLLAAPILLTNA